MSFEATAWVVPNGNRRVRVQVPVVGRNPDGQLRYEGVATAWFVVPAGDPVPRFSVDVHILAEEVSGE